MVLYQNTFEKKTYKHDDSPNSVSTLRGSYGRCKGQCLIKMLALGAGIFPLNFRVKWLLWTVGMRFDCAGPRKVCVRVVGWFWAAAFFSDFFRVYTHTHVIHTWSYIMCTLCTHSKKYIYIHIVCTAAALSGEITSQELLKDYLMKGLVVSRLHMVFKRWPGPAGLRTTWRCRFRAMGLFSAVNS